MQQFSNPVTVAVVAIFDYKSKPSYFRSRGHPVATVCFNSNRSMVWVKSKISFRDGSYGGHFGFPLGMILAILCSTSTCCYIVSFNLIRLVTCKNMSKTVAAILDFHNIILTHFDSKVVLLLQSKFLLKLTKGMGRDVEN